jgi:hypothetical protein
LHDAYFQSWESFLVARHHSAVRFEKQLKRVFDRIDDHLEDRYGARYPLHPARARRGRTSNREDDGLFNVGAAFTAGFGSELGPGYVVEVRLATLADVPETVRKRIEKEVVVCLRKELPRAFPKRELKVKRDGPVYKIYGDLSLGSV